MENNKEEILYRHVDAHCWLKSNCIEATFDAMDEYAKQECNKVFEFAKWASHSDWTYLPSKELWYNEEDEENITPKTTEQLYSLWQQTKK